MSICEFYCFNGDCLRIARRIFAKNQNNNNAKMGLYLSFQIFKFQCILHLQQCVYLGIIFNYFVFCEPFCCSAFHSIWSNFKHFNSQQMLQKLNSEIRLIISNWLKRKARWMLGMLLNAEKAAASCINSVKYII